MEILLVTHRFPPDSMGGTELYTLNLARRLRDAGQRVSVWTYAPGDTRDVVAHEGEYGGIPVWRLAFGLEHTDNPMLEEYDNLRVARFLSQALAGHRPDLLHIAHFGYLSTSVLAVAKQHGIPAVVTLTDFWAICPVGLLLRSDGSLCPGPVEIGECVRCIAQMGTRGARYSALSRQVPLSAWRGAAALCGLLLLRRISYSRWLLALRQRGCVVRERLLGADAILCPGQFLREVLARNGYPLERLRLSPHGIVNPVALRTTRQPSTQGALRFGYIGPLAKHKGAHLPIEAFARLKTGGLATLSYWGSQRASDADRGYAASVLQRISDTPGATHRGQYPNDAVKEVMAGLDVLIMPSLCYENTPTILYEAFASGVPAIASDQGGVRELVQTYQGGWLFPRGDVAALAALMERLILQRDEVAQAAARIRPVPDFADHVREVLDIYERLLRGGGRA